MRSKKNIFALVVAFIAFLIQLRNGLMPPAEPGFMSGGAMNEPSVVVISAILSGMIVWGLLEGLFWICRKLKEQHDSKN